MKKQILKLSLIVAITSIVFSGCKKGENDPFISLKSRTSRITNTWELSSMDYTNTYIGPNYTSTRIYSYNNGLRTIMDTHISEGSSSSDSNTESYTEEMTFDKDGTFELSFFKDGEFESYEGNWAWLGESKNAEIADKEIISLSLTSIMYGSYIENFSGKSNPTTWQFVIDRLSTSELIILHDYQSTDSDGYSVTRSGIITYTKK